MKEKNYLKNGKVNNMVTTVLMGGCGNNCFQIATTIAYAQKWGMDYYIPTKVINPHHKENTSPHFFKNINYSDRELNLPIYREKDFTYEEIPYMKHLCLSGYWQSYLYFNDYREEIIKAFGFDDIQTEKGVCSIHLRRTDYLLYPTMHPVVSPIYLTVAITIMIEKGFSKFKVFSDDIEYCKTFFGNDLLFGDLEFEFSEGKTEIEDLRLMASCESSITANSSFSWWGAYLNPNPNKKVIMPKRWFGEAAKHQTDDLYLPNSIII